MTPLRLVACLLMFPAMCVTCSSAQDWAKAKLEKSPRHGEWVTIKNGARSVQAFVVYPEVKGKAPVVLVIHEIFGLTDWVREVADQLASNGYIAIAPDLLSGMAPGGGRSSDFASVDAAREAVSKLPPEQVTSDLNAAADYAKKLPASNGKLMVAGFCWGGGQSFRFATNRKDLAAAFVFYGPTPGSGMENIGAPVYGFYGGNDARINSTIPDTEKAMKSAGKKYEPVVYEGAGHGFMRSGEDPNGKEADKKAHDEAWARWLKLVKDRS
jgi:carboxymethylenebutenolidase